MSTFKLQRVWGTELVRYFFIFKRLLYFFHTESFQIPYIVAHFFMYVGKHRPEQDKTAAKSWAIALDHSEKKLVKTESLACIKTDPHTQIN